MHKLYPEFSSVFNSQEKLYNYLYGGKAVVTLQSPTGVEHTYSYERPINAHQFPEDVIFVYSLHTEKDEFDNFKQSKFYLGMIECDKFRMTRNSRFGQNSPVVQGAFYIEKLRKSQKFLDASPMRIRHEGTCGSCGSKIWSEKSRECGFGRHCKKLFKLPAFNGQVH